MTQANVATRIQRLFGLTLLTYPAMVIAAIFDWPWPFALCALATFGVEAFIWRWSPAIAGLLNSSHVGWTLRSLVRSMSIIVLLAVRPDTSTTVFVATALSVGAFEAAQAWFRIISFHANSRRKLPMLTRNIDLGKLRIPDKDYGVFAAMTPEGLVNLGIGAIVGVGVGAAAGSAVPMLVGAALAGALIVLGVGRVTFGALRASRISGSDAVLKVVQRQINAFAPEIVVYFSGSAASLYQINMWLDVVAQLKRRSMIILRERKNLRLLGPTSMPVVCVPSAIDLMNFDIPSLRLAMYPANVGKNIHFLRTPGIAHVFIGHGDSDKIASVNPFSKAYDEIWVAGQAGRDRYARAAVGVEDHDIIEVSRPQLASIQHVSVQRSSQVLTVLYAPTWEGWTNDLQNTSVTTMGERIIAALLAHPLNLRVIYKPHPFTGSRDPRAAEANAAIIAAIERANAERQVSDTFPKLAEANVRTSERDLARVGSEIVALTTTAGNVDDATAARDSGRAHPDYAEEANTLSRQWNELYWPSQPEWTHRVVTDSMPALFDCFNNADLLITDISSVVADYLYSEKPYIVTNSSDLADGAFRATYPTASAAQLLGSDCAGLTQVVSELADGKDEWREERRKLKSYLLGPQESSPLDRFRTAVDQALIKAEAMVRPRPGEEEDFGEQPDSADE